MSHEFPRSSAAYSSTHTHTHTHTHTLWVVSVITLQSARFILLMFVWVERLLDQNIVWFCSVLTVRWLNGLFNVGFNSMNHVSVQNNVTHTCSVFDWSAGCDGAAPPWLFSTNTLKPVRREAAGLRSAVKLHHCEAREFMDEVKFKSFIHIMCRIIWLFPRSWSYKRLKCFFE